MKHKTSTKLFSIKALVFVFIFSISSALSAGENEEVQSKDLKQAFQALKKSMKQATQTESKPNDPLDAALDQAFNPLPDEVLNSDVNLDRVDTSESKKAWKEISDIAINDDIEIEYRQKGKALSLLLWSGSRKELQSVLSNILKQLYSDKDSRSYRFIVNSSPIPYIEASSVDLNLEKRIAADQIYERDMAMASKMVSLTGIPRAPKKEEVPVKAGVEIKLSAGMLATFKSVDEMAGQLAKVLATLNPGVYGVQEDTSFTRNQKYFDLINQIVDGGSDNAHIEARKKRAAVIAELSAIERLAAGGFNPWALYYYEERVFSWMADVFVESPNHGLGRFLVESEIWRLQDWSRPLRLQLQSYYMAYLQSKERGKNMRLTETSWSGTMKYIRLRMKLYTKPYFSGMIYQLGVTGSIAAGYLFFPEISHWALTAWQLTTSESGAAKEIVQNPETIGQIAKQGHAISKEILDYSYLSAKVSELSASALSAIEALDGHYGKIIAAGGVIISAGMIAKYRTYIAEFFNSFVPKLDELPETSEAAKKAQEAAENDKAKNDLGVLDSSDSSRVAGTSELSDLDSESGEPEDAAKQTKDKIVVSLAGTVVTIHTRLHGFGQYLINKRNSAIATYTKTQQRVSSAGVVVSRM